MRVEKITRNLGMCISFGFKLFKKTNKKDLKELL